MHHRRDLVLSEAGALQGSAPLEASVLHIQSAARDVQRYPHSNQYSVDLPTGCYTNVSQIKLVAASIPPTRNTLEPGNRTLFLLEGLPGLARSSRPALTLKITDASETRRWSTAADDFDHHYNDVLKIHLPCTMQRLASVRQLAKGELVLQMHRAHDLVGLVGAGQRRLHASVLHLARSGAPVRGQIVRVLDARTCLFAMYRPHCLDHHASEDSTAAEQTFSSACDGCTCETSEPDVESRWRTARGPNLLRHHNNKSAFVYIRPPSGPEQVAEWLTCAAQPICDMFYDGLVRAFDKRCDRFWQWTERRQRVDETVLQTAEHKELEDKFRRAPARPWLACQYVAASDAFTLEFGLEAHTAPHVTLAFGPFLQLWFGDDKQTLNTLPTRPPNGDAIGPDGDTVAIRYTSRHGVMARLCAATAVPCALKPGVYSSPQSLARMIDTAVRTASQTHRYHVTYSSRRGRLCLRATDRHPLRIRRLFLSTRNKQLCIETHSPHRLRVGSFVDLQRDQDHAEDGWHGRHAVIKVLGSHSFMCSHQVTQAFAPSSSTTTTTSSSESSTSASSASMLERRSELPLCSVGSSLVQLLTMDAAVARVLGLYTHVRHASLGGRRCRLVFPCAPDLAPLPFVWLTNEEWATLLDTTSVQANGHARRYWTPILLDRTEGVYKHCPEASAAIDFYPCRNLSSFQIELRAPDGSLLDTQGQNHHLWFSVVQQPRVR